MNKLVLLLCALVAVQVNGAKIAHNQVGDLVDEIKKQLQELKSIVAGDIMAAHDELGMAETDFLTYGDTVVKNGGLALQQEHETIIAQLITIKELAHQANKNISECLLYREDALNRLSGIYTMETFRCVRNKAEESERIVRDSRYIIDISINKVHQLEREVERCGTNLLCLQPILTEIQLDMIRLPQNIKTELDAARQLLATLKLSIDECATVKVSEYASNANSILADITTCVNNIIG